MTDVNEATQAEVEPVLAGALALLADNPDTSLDVLAAEVAVKPEPPLTEEAAPFPALPDDIKLTEEVRRALAYLPDVFNSVTVDGRRRALVQTELDMLTMEQNVIAMIASVLGPRHEVIKEMIRVHMDVAAEEAGVAVPKDKTGPEGEVIVPATPRDQKGHYLLARPKQPHQVPVGPLKWSQEYREAAKPEPSDAALQSAHKAGDVDRPTYLAVTREVRVFDKAKFLLFLRKEPGRALALLRRITVTGKAQSALNLRKQ